MQKSLALKYYPGARWAISRTAKTGQFISLIQDTAITGDDEILTVLITLGLPINNEVLVDYYFPRNATGERCPTFVLMRLWYELSPISAADAIARV